jgi:uncharacterized membrane protein
MGIGGNGTPGDWQTILSQLTFPFTVILSPFVFKDFRKKIIHVYKNSKFTFFCYVTSSFLLIFGIVIGIIPNIGNNNQYNSVSVFVFSSAFVVSTISWLLKERLFDIGCSAVHLNVWNAIYMVPITFIYWPIQIVEIFGGIPANQLAQLTLIDGIDCFFGRYPGCDFGAFLYEFLYSLGTFVAGVCAVILCKQGSASYQWAANIVAVPISCLFFSIPNLPANSTEPLTKYIIISLIIIAVSMLVYHFTNDKIKKTKIDEFNIYQSDV